MNTAHIKIPNHLVGFIEYLFKKTDNGILITRSTDAGRFIASQITRCNTPDKNTGVKFILPDLPEASYQNSFVYFSAEAQSRIIDYLKAEYSLFFRTYCRDSRDLDIKQTEYISYFIEFMKNDKYDSAKRTDTRYRRHLQYIDGLYRKAVKKFIFENIIKRAKK